LSEAPAHPRAIIHLDMDAFYASVEVRDDPSLRGMPVIVGGSERRGVVCAASYEARKFGVRSAQPMATAHRLCPKGVFLPVRMARYREVSRQVFEIFHRYTPLVEPLSVDEAFLDVTGCGRLFGEPEAIARAIRQAVLDETGLTVSAGVAASKHVAKVASDLDKPDGLVVVPAGTEKAFLAPLSVGRLWGVGKVTRSALERMGIRTIGDLAALPVDALIGKFGAHGALLHALANGIDDRQVETGREVKSVGHEDTYEQDIRGRKTMERQLLDLAHRVASRMRRHGFRGRTVTLKVKYADFEQVTRAESLQQPTDDGGTIYRIARRLLDKTGIDSRPVRLLGISVSNLGGEEALSLPESPDGLVRESPRGGGVESGQGGADPKPLERPVQLSLFAPPVPPAPKAVPPPAPSPERQAALNRAVDRIHEKFGRAGILPGRLLEDD
jgi:DNA polymerase-4